MILRTLILCVLISGCASTELITAEKYEQWAEECEVGLQKRNEDQRYNSFRCQEVRRYEKEILWPTYSYPYEFVRHRQTCSEDSHCKIVMTGYIEYCGPLLTEPLMYSTQVVRGKHRQRMLKLIDDKIASEKSEYKKNRQPIEECTETVRPPQVGICWRNQCEIIRTWRKK